MNTQRRNATGRRVAVLGALSAAGLVAADQAEAEIIFTHVDISIPPGSSGGAWDLPGDATFWIARSSWYHTTVPSHDIVLWGRSFAVLGAPYPGPVQSDVEYLRAVDEGQRFPDLEPERFLFAPLNVVSPGGAVAGPGAFTDKYYAFAFSPDGGTSTWYGWMLGSFTNVTYDNLTYHLDSFAYDDTGAVIAMGAVPEPASAAMALLGGALVAGAAGLRRWKKARAGSAS